MRVLIVSSTVWDDANSFGNTFSNLFGGMQDVTIYNVACRHGDACNSVVQKAVQLTDKSVMKSIYQPKFDPCWAIQVKAEETEYNREISVNARKKRRTFSFIIRDMIWCFGRWKKSNTLQSFLKEIRPDVIYLPIYAAPYMCDIQRYIIRKANVPVVGHISDDVYGYAPKCSLLARLYRTGLRRKLRRLIAKCAYLEVFAENMRVEYEKIFNKPCYLIGKGVQIEKILEIEPSIPKKKSLHFVYTGNIGDARYKALADIADAMQRTFAPSEAVLDVYSQTPLTKEMERIFSGVSCLFFHGGIDKARVLEVQNAADFLVHVEGFSKEAVFSAKMSFSTKIVDYMLTGKPILSYGPSCVNSMSVLKEHHIGLAATSMEELLAIFTDIVTDKIDYQASLGYTREYLSKYRNLETVQNGIYKRIAALVEAK